MVGEGGVDDGAKEVPTMRNWYFRCTRDKGRGHAWKRAVIYSTRNCIQGNPSLIETLQGHSRLKKFLYCSLRLMLFRFKIQEVPLPYTVV
ncbi:hypothetical protein L1887_29309 [Cichorium endivia]|nr:hypothetical protein L1887_29309 [Cichorium endivia]